ncbi:MAG: hypothetical protein ACKO3N_05665, partial [Verrucomicrobiota bacterium]
MSQPFGVLASDTDSLPPDPRAGARARQVRSALPAGGLFAGQAWRTAVAPFVLGPALAADLDSLGRVLLQ